MSSSIIPTFQLNKTTDLSFGAIHSGSLLDEHQAAKNSFGLLNSNFGIRSSLFKKLCLVLYLVLFPISSCFASSGNRLVISYFVDNIVFEIIASGGYYSLGTAIILAVLAWRFKKFREVLFSILIASFGIILLVFVYQALEDFDWLPAVY